jgi:DNA-binding XRE family transcriptional regulator
MSEDRVSYGKQRANNVKLHRVMQDLSQTQLAEMVGMTQNRLSKIETGTVKHPSVWEAMRLAHALGVGIEELFDIEKAPH